MFRNHLRVALAGGILVLCHNAGASSNFFDNPLTPYPPSCATSTSGLAFRDLPTTHELVYGEEPVKFYEADLVLADSFNDFPVNVSAYRLGCAEPNRSLVWLVFRISDQLIGIDAEHATYRLPRVTAVDAQNRSWDMRLAPEPNTWGAGQETTSSSRLIGDLRPYSPMGDYRDIDWIFLLDNESPYAAPGTPGGMPASVYNDSFQLVLSPQRPDTDALATHIIEVPSTASLLSRNPALPINGRLSGLWVTEGAPDQGVNLAISTLPSRPLAPFYSSQVQPQVLFFSWYTFDSDGRPMWLTGSAEFETGATEVRVPLVKVSEGKFMGGKQAQRQQAGHVTVRSNHCNDLTLNYSLQIPAATSGVRRLQRLFAMETAGYACRDLESREASG
ncbi:MAG TPA: hypothetical protein VFG52_05180 [Xanthomonadales bacterium]|nr:hypothetical protein [Xanthomonadales bacterium]